jgi:DNA-directed RNA polymerase subunit RPC12/RpoP
MKAILFERAAIPACRLPAAFPLSRLVCALWGHAVDNRRFRHERSPGRQCGCGEPYLRQDGSFTHVRHTLWCFFGHHTYRKLIDRDGHHEYVCVRCGHPLLFAAGTDPYARSSIFDKKVRYLCGLFGHRVRHVADRHGLSEFACHCGHTFLKSQSDVSRVTHPAICVVSGHRIRYVTTRGGYAEYVCRDCGHPFCFAEPVHRPTGEPDPRASASDEQEPATGTFPAPKLNTGQERQSFSDARAATTRRRPADRAHHGRGS